MLVNVAYNYNYFICHALPVGLQCRSTHFWDHIVQTFSEDEWKENFRISRETFAYLCNKLRSKIQRKDTCMRMAVTVEHRLAITLWCLATCCEYRTIGHLFGLARSTVCVIVHDTCAAIVNTLQSQYIVSNWTAPD